MNTNVNTDGIIYLPQSDTYRIKVGKRIVEVDAQLLKQSWTISQIESILKGGSDSTKNYFLDTILNSGGRGINYIWDDTNTCGSGYISSYDPIDALYRGAIDPADTVVACMDLPKPKPYYDPSAVPTIYYNDRFPSVSASSILDEAIKLLNAKKNLHMTKLSVDQISTGFKLVIYSDMPISQGSNKTLVVTIKHAVFDRAYKTEIDKHAGLKAKLDTDTYIKLRIAFLLFEALKIDDYNKQSMYSDIFEVISIDSNVRDTF